MIDFAKMKYCRLVRHTVGDVVAREFRVAIFFS